MMAPVVLMAVISKTKPAKGIILVSLMGVIPDHVGPVALDLMLYLFLIVTVGAIRFIRKGAT